jgi:DNA-binding transcriptional LysR family regulator
VAGTLRLNVPRAAAQLVLPPVVSAFLAAWPKVTLEMVVEDGFVDIVKGGFDAGVRYGESLDRDMIAVPFGGEQRYALVASPAWLAEHGRSRRRRTWSTGRRSRRDFRAARCCLGSSSGTAGRCRCARNPGLCATMPRCRSRRRRAGRDC